MSDINSSLPVTDTADGSTGSAAPTTAIEIGGKDGSGNLQPISVDTTGKVNINNISGTITLPIGASTSSNQTNGSQKTQIVDAYDNVINASNYGTSYGLRVETIDSKQTDNLQRIRVSEGRTIVAVCFDASPQSLLVNTSVTGSATITNNTTIAAMVLTCTTGSSDSAILQTKEYIRYTPGRSYLTMLSGTIGAKKTNVRQRVGYFDSNNGMFFEQTGTDLAVVVRTSTSGSIVDTRILQANWNLDKLDGTGPSGVTLDTSKHNAYIIDFLWLGAGRVRWGVIINGKVIYCNEYIAGNVNTVPFTRTASLPSRAEIENTGVSASSTSLNLVCMSVQRESSDEPFATVTFSQSRGTTALATTGTTKPLMSIRPKTTFNSITNRVTIVPTTFQVLAGSQNTFIQIVLNPTLTGASFTSADPLSAVEFDITATATSGGTILSEFYVAASAALFTDTSSTINNQIESLILALDISGTTGDILSINATSLAGGTNTFGSMGWEEYQ